MNIAIITLIISCVTTLVSLPAAIYALKQIQSSQINIELYLSLPIIKFGQTYKEYQISFRYTITNKSSTTITIIKICAVIEKHEFELFSDLHNGSASFTNVLIPGNASNDLRLAFHSLDLPKKTLKLKIHTNKKVIIKRLNLKKFQPDLQKNR